MGHDDPKSPHHHHAPYHQPDQILSPSPGARPLVVPSTSVDRTPEASATHTHVQAHSADHLVAAIESSEAGFGTPAERRDLAPGAGVGKILHLDCFAGLAGDMIVGALLDLGVPPEPLQRALDALPLGGFRVGTLNRASHAIVATQFVVEVTDSQPYRTYRDIRSLLVTASLDEGVRRRALEAFHALAVAEGRIHRIAPEDVHFHEVGAVDAIVDIVAASAALDWLGARVTCAPLPMGRGFAKAEHGTIPLPAPAVVELLIGIPTEETSLDLELVTPTGAAIVRANASEFVRWPSIRPMATGFGAGTRALPDRPNLLRAVLGSSEPTSDSASVSVGYEQPFATLESNIDDATGEIIAHVTDALLREGALDAWTAPIGMKKGRPGILLSALAHRSQAERLARVIMAESSTLGVRIRPTYRIERPRRVVHVETPYGSVPVKVADGDGLPITAKPEYEVVHAVARERGVAVKTVHAAALATFWSAELGRGKE